MKDLKRYITKHKKIDLKSMYSEKSIENSNHILFSYLLINSFKKQRDCSDGYVQMCDDDYEMGLYLNPMSSYYLEDYDMDAQLTRNVILDATLPEYIYDEAEFYVSEVENDKEQIEESRVEVKNLFKKYKLYSRDCKRMLNFIDENISDEVSFYFYIIKSKWLRKISKDPELKNLLEQGLAVEFVKPDTVIGSWCYYQEVGTSEEQIEPVKLYQFIELFKKKYRLCKRMYEENYHFAETAYECENDKGGFVVLIATLLDKYDTQTEVMF